jgi:thiopurine S-methyltransferase
VTPEYWHERWREGRIGFHLPDPNPRLVTHHDQLADCRRVLVPLCGKSADLAWLAMQGHEVVGVELSELAARAFFEERRLEPSLRDRGGFVEYTHGAVTILVGDFFATDRELIASCDAAYDRAALIALPPELRARYVTHLLGLLSPKAKLLLLTLHYDAAGGPPFDVAPHEVSSSYAGTKLSLLESRDARLDAPGPVERGASFVQENVYLIELPPDDADQVDVAE